MSKTIIKIGPADHGRRLELDEFTDAEAEDGRVYELGRGIVSVVEIPKKRHMLQVAAARDQLQDYKASHPGRIQVIASGNECKITIVALRSERHPDLAVCLIEPPTEDDEEFWMRWVPEIVIEVVSVSSRNRDYHEKPEDYLRAGIKEYWIIDADRRALTVMRRSRGGWIESTVSPPAVYRTRLLPGLAFSIEAVFAAGGLA